MPETREIARQEWFTASELAGIPGLRIRMHSVRKRAHKEGWATRERPGAAGGRMYHYTALPLESRVYLGFLPQDDLDLEQDISVFVRRVATGIRNGLPKGTMPITQINIVLDALSLIWGESFIDNHISGYSEREPVEATEGEMDDLRSDTALILRSTHGRNSGFCHTSRRKRL